MTIDELAQDLALKLTVDEGRHFIRIWRAEDDWGWDPGEGTFPENVEVVHSDYLDNSDDDLGFGPDRVDEYAAQLRVWLHSL